MGNSLRLPDVGPVDEGLVLEQVCVDQIQRIMDSATLQSSMTVRELFSFLAMRALQGDSEQLKEYTIGVEALKRREDFDPKSDPIVRVQMHRLRQKLREYYDGEGREDPVVIELPKGHYVLRFQVPQGLAATQNENNCDAAQEDAARYLTDDLRADGGVICTDVDEVSAAEQLNENGVLGEGESSTILPTLRSQGWPRALSRWWLVVAAIGVSCFAIGVAIRPELPLGHRSVDAAPQRNPVTAFWSALLKNDSNPIICYPDTVFLLDKDHDLFWFPSGADGERGALVNHQLAMEAASAPSLIRRAGPLYYENGYTGIGELKAVARLVALFTRLGKHASVLSSREITANNLQAHTVIFLGSPAQNAAVGQLPSGEFKFEFDLSGKDPGDWNGEIAGRLPNHRQKTFYETQRNPETGVLKTDYALFSVEPGISPGHYIVIIAGLDTTGTEGSAKFATSITGMDALMRTLKLKGLDRNNQRPSSFQALLRVHLENGYEVLNSNLMAVTPFHPIPQAK